MQTKKIIMLLVLVGILLVGSSFVRGVAPVEAALAIQTDGEEPPDEEVLDEEQVSEAQVDEAQTLLNVIQANPQLGDFEALIKAAGLADNLEKDGPFTVFAPTDAAIASLETFSAGSEATVTEILLYHIINGQYYSQDLSNYGTLPTLLGEHVAITVRGGQIILNDMNNSVAITMTDVEAENGIIHIVDTVLMPPVNSLITTDKGSREHTIDEVLAADGRFTTFLSLLESTSLHSKLANLADTHTVFAPTNDAFAKLSEEQLNQLLANPQELETLLTYHLVGDTLGVNQIATDDYIPTLEGRPLIVTIDENLQVRLNNQSLTEFNIIAANGVIHVTDTVLMP
jgi:transforming growth factor-beta-induced protein